MPLSLAQSTPSTMARYLSYFTAVGDEPEVAGEEEEELQAASEELSPATGLFPTTLSFRQSLQRLYSCDRFQVGLNTFNASVARATSSY